MDNGSEVLPYMVRVTPVSNESAASCTLAGGGGGEGNLKLSSGA